MSPGGIAFIAVTAFAAGFALGCKPEKHSGDQRPDGDHPFIPARGLPFEQRNPIADDFAGVGHVRPGEFFPIEADGFVTLYPCFHSQRGIR